MLYQIQFQDGTFYKGGNSYRETLWNSMPNKPIKQIAFVLPDGNLMVLKNYESYNHFIEATQNLYGKDVIARPILRYQYLMGKIGNKVVSYRISLYAGIKEKCHFHSKYRIGDITRREYEFGKEYANKPTSGWKKGIIK